jgi:hypothetical protein
MTELKEITTKSGFTIKESWCRKCAKMRPASEFYDSVDNGLVDTSGIMSVCKSCIQKLYDKIFIETESIERTIHKICILLNVKFSNEIVDATRKHIETLQENGKNVNMVFGIYKQKITATNKSMDKSIEEYNGYFDVGTIFTEKQIDVKKIPIPQEVIDFWGDDMPEEDILFLEKEFASFTQTHSTDTRAEVVLLKQVCFNLLDIKKERLAGNNTIKLVKELQELMTKLAISPNVAKSNSLNAGGDSFGQWIADIEKEEPAQWLKSDPKGEIYRDVGNTEEYFQKYIVRPLKNFIQGSRDFNTDENEEMEKEFDDGEVNNFINIDDGEID